MVRRGQAALEFLTTYGWAMLVILVMIGAISYFGVMNPNSVLPNRCVVTTDLSCVDYVIQSASEEVHIQVKQGIGKTIYAGTGLCTYNGVPASAGDSFLLIDGNKVSPGDSWAPKDTVEILCTFAPGTFAPLVGEKVKVLYNISYTLTKGGFAHVAEGEIFTEVQ